MALARGLSIVGHPFTFILLLLLLPFLLQGERQALWVTGIVAVAGMVPLSLIIRRRCVSGRWQSVDASRRTERTELYRAIFIIFAPLGLYIVFIERAAGYVRGSVMMALMLGAAAFLNRWIKLSLHLAIASFFAVVLMQVRMAYGLMMMLVFIPALAWSRLALGRHTIPEVIGGMALGATAGGIMAWWS